MILKRNLTNWIKVSSFFYKPILFSLFYYKKHSSVSHLSYVKVVMISVIFSHQNHSLPFHTVERNQNSLQMLFTIIIMSVYRASVHLLLEFMHWRQVLQACCHPEFPGLQSTQRRWGDRRPGSVALSWNTERNRRASRPSWAPWSASSPWFFGVLQRHPIHPPVRRCRSVRAAHPRDEGRRILKSFVIWPGTCVWCFAVELWYLPLRPCSRAGLSWLGESTRGLAIQIELCADEVRISSVLEVLSRHLQQHRSYHYPEYHWYNQVILPTAV